MIIKQPNGLYCIYSNQVDTFVACNLTKEQVFVELLSDQITGMIRSIKKTDEKGANSNLIEMMITKAKKLKKDDKDDLEFLENFEYSYDQLVEQEEDESAKNIVNSIHSYLEECDSVLLEDFQDFFENSSPD